MLPLTRASHVGKYLGTGVLSHTQIRANGSIYLYQAFPFTAESFGVSALVRGGPEARFHQGSTRVPPGFHKGSTRVPPGFPKVLRGLQKLRDIT